MWWFSSRSVRFALGLAAVVLLAPLALASGTGIAAVRDEASALKFRLPPPPKDYLDGLQMTAFAMGLPPLQLRNAIRNGVTPGGNSCPPAPLDQCTEWYDSEMMMKKMFEVFMIEVEGAAEFPSCSKMAHFAGTVYDAKNAHVRIDDALKAIASISTDNLNKATILQGIAVAIYADGSLNHKRASATTKKVCHGLPYEAE